MIARKFYLGWVKGLILFLRIMMSLHLVVFIQSSKVFKSQELQGHMGLQLSNNHMLKEIVAQESLTQKEEI